MQPFLWLVFIIQPSFLFIFWPSPPLQYLIPAFRSSWSENLSLRRIWCWSYCWRRTVWFHYFFLNSHCISVVCYRKDIHWTWYWGSRNLPRLFLRISNLFWVSSDRCHFWSEKDKRMCKTLCNSSLKQLRLFTDFSHTPKHFFVKPNPHRNYASFILFLLI